jgi:hypothetical protein
MENIENFSFQVDSAIVKKARLWDNFLIINENKHTSTVPICAVYFSSNFLYFPNNEFCFKSNIIEKDRYEWWNLRYPAASKHIFIRDIYKQWYLHGINDKINSIEKLQYLLSKELVGYNSVFIGSSAGGFAAVLLGSLLNVERIFAFNSQFYLSDLLNTSNSKVDPLVFREQNNMAICKYYKLNSFIKNPGNVYYFLSNKSEWDVRQYDSVKNIGMNVISINTSVHGMPLLKNNLIELFKLTDLTLQSLTHQKLNPIGFSIKLIGFKKTAFFIVQMIPNAYVRFVHNPILRILIKINE